MFTPTMFTPTPPYVGVFPLRGDVHSFKPNFLKADSLAFALSCDRILDLLFVLSSMLIMASSSSDLVNDR